MKFYAQIPYTCYLPKVAWLVNTNMVAYQNHECHPPESHWNQRLVHLNLTWGCLDWSGGNLRYKGEIVGSSKEFIEVKAKLKCCDIFGDLWLWYVTHWLHFSHDHLSFRTSMTTTHRRTCCTQQWPTNRLWGQGPGQSDAVKWQHHSDSPTMARGAPLSGTTAATCQQADCALLLTVASSCQFISCVSYQFGSAGFQQWLTRWMACGAWWVHKHLY
jgi:hypothetical protein